MKNGVIEFIRGYPGNTEKGAAHQVWEAELLRLLRQERLRASWWLPFVHFFIEFLLC